MPRNARPRLALVALAFASFCFVAAETMPIGLLPQIARGLHTSDSAVGLLLTFYAAVAAITAIPLTALTTHIRRDRLLVVLVGAFGVSQLATAVAPNYAALAVARVVCAVAHGVFWSIVIPTATRLVPPGQGGRATTAVFTGTSLAVVLGVPLGTALGVVTSWRIALAAVGLAAALSTVIIAYLVPNLEGETAAGLRQLRSIPMVLRNRSVVAFCVITMIMIVGDFSAYTYTALIVKRDAALAGTALAAVLLLYGLAGIVGNTVAGPHIDRRARRTFIVSTSGLVAAFVLLEVGRGTAVTAVAMALWGLALLSTIPSLQAGVIRVAPEGADTASAVYVVAFQIGIGAGALLGGILVAHGHLGLLPALGAIGAAGALAVAVLTNGAYPRPDGATPKQRGAAHAESAVEGGIERVH